MDAAQYEQLAKEARGRAETKIAAAKQKYGLGTYSRYELDLARATIRSRPTDVSSASASPRAVSRRAPARRFRLPAAAPFR